MIIFSCPISVLTVHSVARKSSIVCDYSRSLNFLLQSHPWWQRSLVSSSEVKKTSDKKWKENLSNCNHRELSSKRHKSTQASFRFLPTSSENKDRTTLVSTIYSYYSLVPSTVLLCPLPVDLAFMFTLCNFLLTPTIMPPFALPFLLFFLAGVQVHLNLLDTCPFIFFYPFSSIHVFPSVLTCQTYLVSLRLVILIC